MIGKLYKALLLLLTAIVTFSSCTATEEPQSGHGEKAGLPVELTIQVPQSNVEGIVKRSIGDPGTDIQEDDVWDRLLIVVAYTQKNTDDQNEYDPHPKQMVYYECFTREQFDNLADESHGPNGGVLSPVLNADGTDSGLRRFVMYLPVGKVRVYGLTYNQALVKDGYFNPEATVKAYAVDDATVHTGHIEAMTIPNSYADMAYSPSAGYTGQAAFLSVATGYGMDNSLSATLQRDLEIARQHDASYMNQHWGMTLRRLAAKIDIQWDATSGFTLDSKTGKRLTDVKVTAFSYDGHTARQDAGKGWGRLFPTLQTAGVEPLGGTSSFLNVSEVSQRNGRVTHLVFPDGARGSNAPVANFQLYKKITTTSKDAKGNEKTDVTEQTSSVTLSFKSLEEGLQPAAWYKVNVTIKGDNIGSTITKELQ